MPWGLKRFQESRQLHFITFSCYRRKQKLANSTARTLVERALEMARRRYKFCVFGYVVMPEHVHLLVSEPERGLLSQALQAIKQSVARRLALNGREAFWQERYYDFNVWTEKKRIEKLKYMHRNPAKRGLCADPGEWQSSSFCHYATGVEGIVELESQWTGRKRERAGVKPEVARRNIPAQAKSGLERGTPPSDGEPTN